MDKWLQWEQGMGKSEKEAGMWWLFLGLTQLPVPSQPFKTGEYREYMHKLTLMGSIDWALTV